MGCFIVLLLGLLATPVWAQFPGQPGSDTWIYRPNDPTYVDMWHLYSHLPKDHNAPIAEGEREMGSGMHVDRAWQLHTGTPDTLIAILDSGMYWDNRDLIDQYFLNRRELPLPQGSLQYDANYDGRFSITDYSADSRVFDINDNGLIDPGDLIKIFSDDRDDDGNGFVDDIAGWDFHENDNDPADRTNFGHGNGEAKDSVARIDNGMGQPGICGHCSFVMLRVDDSFVVDANAFSAAVRYGTDSGVDLIQQALGAYNWSQMTLDAIEHATENGVVIIGSAADEYSYHHNYPSSLDPIVYTNALRFDTRNANDATTFLNLANCSNYGARIDVSTSGVSCSSEATANLSGITALALSYGKFLGQPLSPLEAISLIKNAATDIDLGPAPADGPRFPSYNGWDSLTGYGRSNAYAMLDAIKENKVPPALRIKSPQWFAVYNARETASIEVSVSIPVPRAGSFRYQLTVQRGIESFGATSSTVLSSDELTAEVAKTISVPKSAWQALPQSTLENSRNSSALTLILKVDDMRGLVAEARRTVFVIDEPTLLAGFPKFLGGSGESGAIFLDLNHDGLSELVIGDGSGFLHALTIDGRESAGFPAKGAQSRFRSMTDPHEYFASITAPLSAGDLVGDEGPEIVAVTSEAQVLAFDQRGQVLAGFPVELPFPDFQSVSQQQRLAKGALAAPVIVDLEGDGEKEILVAAFDGHIHVLTANGNRRPGFPVAPLIEGLKAKILSSPAVFDLDGDGTKDMIFGTNHVGQRSGFLFAISGESGESLAGFPVRIPLLIDVVLPTVGTGIPTSPAVGDVDGDGEPEILIHGFAGKVYVVGKTGILKRSLDMGVAAGQNTNDQFMIAAFGHPILGDLNSDHTLDPVTVGVGKRILTNLALAGRRFDYDHMVASWHGSSGQMQRGFPRKSTEMMLFVSPLVVDVDGDGVRDVLAASSGYFLHGENANGAAQGFPKFTGGWMFAAPSLGDMDGDGLLELAATTREGYVFVWRTGASVTELRASGSAATFKGNQQRTGVYR